MSLYRIPVEVVVITFRPFQAKMRDVTRHGRLIELDGKGYYLVVSEADDVSDPRLRKCGSLSFKSSVVVRAGNIYEAIGAFHRHPGVVGTGRERPDAKAIRLDTGYSAIMELPDCDLDQEYEGGCFSISPDGWAMCQYVKTDTMNKKYGYCHCVLQDCDEPATGCMVENYEIPISVETIEAIKYFPIDPEAVEKASSTNV